MPDTAVATPAFAQTMAAYNGEMNRRVFSAAARLPDAARRADGGAFWGSIHGTLSHLYWGDRMWMARFGVGERPDVPIAESANVVADFDDLADRRIAFDDEIAEWAAGLSPRDLEGELTWWSGALEREVTRSRALCVVHMFNHQTHHRGQAHALITRAGEQTGATDLPFILP